MKVIVAGSRSIRDYDYISSVIADSGFEVTEIVHGGARGVDILGKKWAEDRGLPVKEFLANWEEHGKSAGYKRNAQMAEYADALVTAWDGISRGTMHMQNIAYDRGLKVYNDVVDGIMSVCNSGKWSTEEDKMVEVLLRNQIKHYTGIDVLPDDEFLEIMVSSAESHDWRLAGVPNCVTEKLACPPDESEFFNRFIRVLPTRVLRTFKEGYIYKLNGIKYLAYQIHNQPMFDCKDFTQAVELQMNKE